MEKNGVVFLPISHRMCFFGMTMTLDQDLQLYMSPFSGGFANDGGFPCVERSSTTRLRPFAPPSLCSPMSLQNLVPKATPRTPGGFRGWFRGRGNGSICFQGMSIGTRDPVAMVGMFIPRISEEIRTKITCTCLVQMGRSKNHRTQLVFFGECNIKKKTMFIHFWGI